MPSTVTKTIKSAGGDYSSISGWEAGEQGDLVAADELREGECYAFADSTAAVIDGSTTDATRYMRLFMASGQGHAGYADTSKFRMTISGTAKALEIKDHFFRVEGIQIELSGTGTTHGIYVDINGSAIRAYKCIVRGTGVSGAGGFTFGYYSYDGGLSCYNCIASDIDNSDFAGTGQGFRTEFGSLNAYNCVAVACGSGFQDGSLNNLLAKNCLSYCDLTNSARVDFSGTLAAATDYNASTDATASGANSLISQAAADLDITSITATDAGFLEIAGTSTLVNAGTDDPASGVYSDDIRGTARSSPWDIGVDEFVAAGDAVPVAWMQYRPRFSG